MGKTVTLSDDLAALVEARRRNVGHPTLDAAVEALVTQGLLAEAEENHSAGRTDDALRVLIEEAEASGPAESWDFTKDRAEVLRRYASRRGA